MIDNLKDKPNPFSAVRVDNPFQTFPDLKELYGNEFKKLKLILSEVKNDPNHQSRGIVIAGNAGNGKTHIIMRLAKEILNSNRLFFIRQPNNPSKIKYHIYQRMLESFFEKIPNTPYTQLEYLLARTFSDIVITMLRKKANLTQNEEKLISLIKEEPLNLFSKLGQEGSDKKRRNWKSIEQKTLKYWEERFGLGGYSLMIIKGLIKFCSYSDENKREIIRRWLSGIGVSSELLKTVELEDLEELEREDFALEAIITFGKLSLNDEPLILVFDQLEGLKHDPQLAMAFVDGLKELFTHLNNSIVICNLFPDRWRWFKDEFDNSVIDRMGQSELYLNKPSSDVIAKILDIRLKSVGLKSDFFDEDELERISEAFSIRESLSMAYKIYEKKVFGVEPKIEAKSFEEKVFDEIKEIKEDIRTILQFLGVKKPKTKPSYGIASYFNEIKSEFDKKYALSVFSEDDDYGKLKKYISLLKRVKQIKAKEEHFQIRQKVLPTNIILNDKVCIAFLYEGGKSLTSRMKNFNPLVLNNKKIHFYLIRDSRSDELKSQNSKQLLAQFQNIQNTTYIEMGKNNRGIFDTIDRMIDDIHNKDLKITEEDLVDFFEMEYSGYWLVESLKQM